MAVYADAVAVIFVILGLAPFVVVGKHDFGVLHFASVFADELLSQLTCSSRTVFDTAAARHALVLVHVGDIG